MSMRPAMIGSLAAEAVEPRQVWKEAALRRLLWVTRKTWLSPVSWTYPPSGALPRRAVTCLSLSGSAAAVADWVHAGAQRFPLTCS